MKVADGVRLRGDLKCSPPSKRLKRKQEGKGKRRGVRAGEYRKRDEEEEGEEMVGGRSVSLGTVRAALCVCVCMLCLYFTDLRGRREERESHCIEKRKMEEKEAHHGGP